MTRKDYEAIARAFSDAHEFPPEDTKEWDAMWRSLRAKISDVFQADNPRFDRQRFYKATEGEEKGDK